MLFFTACKLLLAMDSCCHLLPIFIWLDIYKNLNENQKNNQIQSDRVGFLVPHICSAHNRPHTIVQFYRPYPLSMKNYATSISSKGKELASKTASVASKSTASAKDAASKGAASAADAASKGAASAADAASKGADSAAHAAAKHMPVASATVAAATAKSKAAVEKGASMATAAAGKILTAAEQEARAAAFVLIDDGIVRAMPKLTAYVKKELVDPDMPGAVVRGLEAVIDTSMLEVRDVLKETLMDTVLVKVKDKRITAPPLRCCTGEVCAPCICMRAAILYILFPHDRTIWSQLKNPWWWLLTAISVFPLWGVRVLWWVFLFLIQDRTDDYQLCNYVITFKASLFIAGGLQSAILGTAIAHACLEDSNCDEAAPGSSPAGFEFGVIGALLQAASCWLAMAFLPWASPKGGMLYDVPSAASRRMDHATIAKTKGGRLWYFMLYDTLILAACVGGGAFAWYATDEPGYVARSRVYHIRMLYSMLAFPWFLLKLPLAYTFVLHLKPTGYNQSGEVMRLCNGKERRIARKRHVVVDTQSAV